MGGRVCTLKMRKMPKQNILLVLVIVICNTLRGLLPILVPRGLITHVNSNKIKRNRFITYEFK